LPTLFDFLKGVQGVTGTIILEMIILEVYGMLFGELLSL